MKILDASSAHILRYGGHAGAAGCTICVDQFAPAEEALLLAASQQYAVGEFVPTLSVDTVLDPTRIDTSFMRQIESLRPF